MDSSDKNKKEETELQKKFGEHLRYHRDKSGIGSREMARRIYMDSGNYTRLEMGRTNPTLITLMRICTCLEISLEEFFKEFPSKRA